MKRFLQLAIVICLLWTAWPYYSLYSLAKAIDEGDEFALQSQVDWNSVRSGLKADVNIMMAKAAAKNTGDKTNGLASGIIAAFGPILADKLIDAYVTPQDLATMIREGKINLPNEKTNHSSQGHKKLVGSLQDATKKLEYAFFTHSPFLFLVKIRNEKTEGQTTDLLLKYQNLGWELISLRLAKNADAGDPEVYTKDLETLDDTGSKMLERLKETGKLVDGAKKIIAPDNSEDYSKDQKKDMDRVIQNNSDEHDKKSKPSSGSKNFERLKETRAPVDGAKKIITPDKSERYSEKQKKDMDRAIQNNSDEQDTKSKPSSGSKNFERLKSTGKLVATKERNVAPSSEYNAKEQQKVIYPYAREEEIQNTPTSRNGKFDAHGVKFDDLIERDGVLYKKFTDVPYTGKVTGRLQGTVRKGKIDGPFNWLDESGRLEFQHTYKNGVLDGPWAGFFDDGQLRSEGTYKNDKKYGTWAEYHDNGQLQSETTYGKDGRIVDGPYVTYHELGQVSEKGTYKTGHTEGPYVEYHANGKVSEKGTYKSGSKEGPYVTYRQNGKVSEKGTYKENLREGPFVGYHINGQVESKGTYKDGGKEGTWAEYHDNGQLSSKGTYRDDVKEGTWAEYHDNGQLKSKRTYGYDGKEGTSDANRLAAVLEKRASPMTMSEMDSVRHQIEQNWSIPSGAQDANNLIITVRIFLNRNGSLARNPD